MMFVSVLATVILVVLFIYWFAGETESQGNPYPMITALQQRDKSKVRALAAQPRHRNVKTHDGDTPLHFAARLNAVDMAGILLNAGADPNVKNKHGYTPLMITAERGYKRMARLILKNGAEVQTTGSQGKSAVDLAQKRDNKDLLYLLDQSKMMSNKEMVA